MNEEGANLGCVMMRVEEVVVPVGPLIGAVEGFAFAPAATGDDDQRGLRFRRAILDNQVCAVGNELSIDSEDSGERALHLRLSVVLRLELTDRSVDEGAEDGKIRKKGGTDARVCLHDEPMQIVAAKTPQRFWYLFLLKGRYDAGAVLAARRYTWRNGLRFA